MKYLKMLYVQVLIAILAGILIGVINPSFAVKLKPFGDGFIKLVKMLISPIIFCTIINGISGMQDTRKLGRVGLKAIIYFEIVNMGNICIQAQIFKIITISISFNNKPISIQIIMTFGCWIYL